MHFSKFVVVQQKCLSCISKHYCKRIDSTLLSQGSQITSLCCRDMTLMLLYLIGCSCSIWYSSHGAYKQCYLHWNYSEILFEGKYWTAFCCDISQRELRISLYVFPSLMQLRSHFLVLHWITIHFLEFNNVRWLEKNYEKWVLVKNNDSQNFGIFSVDDTWCKMEINFCPKILKKPWCNVCVQAIIFETVDIETSVLVHWCISRSSVSTKVVGSRSRPLSEKC